MHSRLLPILLVALLGSACSFSGIGEPAADPPPDDSDMRAAYKEIRDAYAGFKLSGKPEMSRVHRVRGGYLAEWAICVRNDDPGKRQHYTFYFKNRKITEWRLSAIVEGCEAETFTPLPPAPPEPSSMKDR
jgi:hypothetical protein